MKLLLTSAGIKNPTIHNALVELLGKPIAESSALCISTAAYAFPGGADIASRLIRGTAASPLCELGWKSLGVLELTALPSLPETVYVGVSGGSLVMGPHVGDDFVYGNSPLGVTMRWGWSTFRCSRTWITRGCRTIPWLAPRSGLRV